MELKDYTIKELCKELKRRVLFVKKRKVRERVHKPICNNCKHCIIEKTGNVTFYYCSAKPYTLENGRTINYLVNFMNECQFNLFEHK